MTNEQLDEDAMWSLAVATNAAFKGLMGYFGQSGHVCQRTIAVAGWLDTSKGETALIAEMVTGLANSGELNHGDTVVVAETPVAVAQGRLVSRRLLNDVDPKRSSRSDRLEILDRIRAETGMICDEEDLIRLDWYESDGESMALMGGIHHNEFCHTFSRAISAALDVEVDVVVSDTDTGIDVRRMLIGTFTIGATPLGATAGLTLYETMRCAVAAEFERGHTKGVPLVICRPADRLIDRANKGAMRSYGGRLDASKEPHAGPADQ